MFGQSKKKKSVTRSVFELQKKYSTQNSCPGNFQNILLNKLLPRRPLTSIFGDRDLKKQLLTAEKEKFVTRSVFGLQKSFSTQNSCPENFQNFLLNKLLHRRPLKSVFGYHDMKTAVDSC